MKESLKHILWIGGATDAGKSTAAHLFAERHQFEVYHYDHSDQQQSERLAASSPFMRQVNNMTLDERWIDSTPEELFKRLFTIFPLRFPLVLEEILARPTERPIVVEGFGILPELVAPYLTSPQQAIWFVPTHEFKLASMERRNKPSFAAKTRDPKIAKRHLYERDMLLADYLSKQVPQFDFHLHQTDGSLSIEQTVEMVDTFFQPYFDALGYLPA